MVEAGGGGPLVNPYAPPRTRLSGPAGEPGALDELTREEVDAFVGKRKGDYYWRHWSRSTNRQLNAFNWAAGFFSLFWLLYRRMYKEFAVALAALVASAVVELVLEPLVGEAKGSLSRALNFLPGLTIGILGNRLYLRRARVAAAAARLCTTPGERDAALAASGGMSWLAALIAVAVLAMLVILPALLGGAPPNQ
jgi:hypothetical protein